MSLELVEHRPVARSAMSLMVARIPKSTISRHLSSAPAEEKALAGKIGRGGF